MFPTNVLILSVLLGSVSTILTSFSCVALLCITFWMSSSWVCFMLTPHLISTDCDNQIFLKTAIGMTNSACLHNNLIDFGDLLLRANVSYLRHDGTRKFADTLSSYVNVNKTLWHVLETCYNQDFYLLQQGEKWPIISYILLHHCNRDHNAIKVGEGGGQSHSWSIFSILIVPGGGKGVEGWD